MSKYILCIFFNNNCDFLFCILFTAIRSISPRVTKQLPDLHFGIRSRKLAFSYHGRQKSSTVVGRFCETMTLTAAHNCSTNSVLYAQVFNLKITSSNVN